ncbi:MAG: hypothetical protein PF450_06390 [Bacteroidales bacterium]|jgi:hypothetical protein|nr:hypothetical protein [Bacteroidales bacterium]
MKNVLKIILTLLILSFFSCNPTDSGEIVNFKITNRSDEEIELVYLSTVFNEAKTADDNIDINNSIEIEFSFRDVTKSDGA